MDAPYAKALRTQLLKQRYALLLEVGNVENDLEALAGEREMEFEEAAQEERLTRVLSRLDDRARAELTLIERALERIDRGEYGTCEICGEEIMPERLSAVPATPYCRDCAKQAEGGAPLRSAEAVPDTRSMAPDYRLLSDPELETTIFEYLREDERLDLDELRITCRRGVVHLTGAVPSEAQRQIILHTITDIMGLTEVLDHVSVKEILWERDDRTKTEIPPQRNPWDEQAGANGIEMPDISEEIEEYAPADRPLPEEE